MTDGGLATKFTAGAIGEPGQRTFYLYVVIDDRPLWFLAEKGQVAALGSQSIESIPRTGLSVDEEAVEAILEEGMDVPWPTNPDDVRFRIDSMALRVDPETSAVTVYLTGTEGEEFSFDVSIDHLRAMAVAALASVQAGRPICPKCQLPEDPEGHDCPSSNGHKHLTS